MITVNVDVFDNCVIIRKKETHEHMLLLEDTAIEVAYKILSEFQTMDQVMDHLQAEIDEEIERDHGKEIDDGTE